MRCVAQRQRRRRPRRRAAVAPLQNLYLTGPHVLERTARVSLRGVRRPITTHNTRKHRQPNTIEQHKHVFTSYSTYTQRPRKQTRTCDKCVNIVFGEPKRGRWRRRRRRRLHSGCFILYVDGNTCIFDIHVTPVHARRVFRVLLSGVSKLILMQVVCRRRPENPPLT